MFPKSASSGILESGLETGLRSDRLEVLHVGSDVQL